MSLNQEFIQADIEAYQKRKERAQIRKNTAQVTIDNLNRRIKAKQALLQA